MISTGVGKINDSGIYVGLTIRVGPTTRPIPTTGPIPKMDQKI